MKNPYLAATRRIPKGQTRTYAEVAVLAGRPAAARTAGRALLVAARGDESAWHRVTSANGDLSREPELARLQLERLRAEGARPREGESLRAWARRVRRRVIARLDGRAFLPASDERVERWPPARVEALVSEAAARARGFRHLDAREGGSAGPRRRQALEGSPATKRFKLASRRAAPTRARTRA